MPTRLFLGTQSDAETGLSLQFWKMQGDLAEMQGDPKLSPRKNRCFTIAYRAPSLLNEQGEPMVLSRDAQRAQARES